jgi:hypothetical protein
MRSAIGSDGGNAVSITRETDDVLAHWLHENAEAIESELEALERVATAE